MNHERNLTDIMQVMIDNERVFSFFLDGRYVNVNCIEDMEKAKLIVNQSGHHSFG